MTDGEQALRRYLALFQASNRLILVRQIVQELERNPAFAEAVSRETFDGFSETVETLWNEVYTPMVELENELRDYLKTSVPSEPNL